MPRPKKGKGPKKKPKTLYSGEKNAEATEDEETTAEKSAQEFEKKSEDKVLKTQEEAYLQMFNKMPWGQYGRTLVYFVETTAFNNMMKKQSRSVRLLADLIDKMMGNPTKSYNSFDSQINASKARKELHPLIITKIIANIEFLSFKEESSEVKNISDVIYWYDRLLLSLKKDRKDENENYGVLRDIHAVCILQGRLKYYEPGIVGNFVIPNNDLSNVELEEVLDLKKQLVVICPCDVNFLSIAMTFNQLGRYL